MFQQFKALLWLKYKAFRGKGSTSRIISMVVHLLLAIGALGAFTLSSIVGVYFASRFDAIEEVTAQLLSPQSLVLMGGIDILLILFAFFWFTGLMIELQRQDTFDLRVLMHLPISLPMIFGLNYLVSLINLSTILLLPGMLSFALGLVYFYDAIAILFLPGILLLFLLFGAWSYYLRGLMAILMENKRRRFLLTALPIFFVLLFQLPQILLRFSDNPTVKTFLDFAATYFQDEQSILQLHLLLPPTWLSYGIVQINEGQVLHGLAAFAGMGLFTFWGLYLGYRSTLRYYRDGGDKGSTKETKAKPKKDTTPWTSWHLPGFANDTAALAWTAFLSYARQPNIRMLFIMPIVMGLVMLLIFSNPQLDSSDGNGDGPGSWLPLLVLLWPFLNFSSVFTNLFGFDTTGFRGTVLLPTDRSKVILAKNLGLFPLVCSVCAIMVLLGAAIFQTPLKSVAISLLQIPQLFFIYCILGNLMSIYLPFTISRNTLRVQGNRAILFLTNLIALPLLVLLSIPTALCFNADALATHFGYGALPWGFMLSTLFLAACLLAYRSSLRHTGDLLLEREQKILLTLQKEQG